jgi:ABC-2 type transport system ATP-binding protein
VSGVHEVTVSDGRARFEVDAGAMAAVLDHVRPYGVIDLTATPPTLEELFLRHYQGAPEVVTTR